MSQKTLTELRLPTVPLVESMLGLPKEAKILFIKMLAIYKHSPNEETANKIKEIVYCKKSLESKKEAILKMADNLPSGYCYLAKEDFENRKLSPKALPNSGEFLLNMGYISPVDKQWILVAQTAARMIEALNNPHAINLQDQFFENNEDELVEAKSYLNRPEMMDIQRIEHLTNIFAYLLDKEDEMLTQLKNCAINHLYLAAENISNKGVKQKVIEACKSLNWQKTSHCSKKDISQKALEIIPLLINFNEKELFVAKSVLAKRARQLIALPHWTY